MSPVATSLVILMIEEEQPEGLSSRKLVVETAKHNVLTSYTGGRGVALLRRFPNVDAILVHSAVLNNYKNLIKEVRGIAPDVPIILAKPLHHGPAEGVDYIVDSHTPQEVLLILKQDIVPRVEKGEK